MFEASLQSQELAEGSLGVVGRLALWMRADVKQAWRWSACVHGPRLGQGLLASLGLWEQCVAEAAGV